MNLISPHVTIRSEGVVRANAPVSSGLLRLDLELEPSPPAGTGFLPGQFAMLNLTGSGSLVFSRPFSILDWQGNTVSFLYRVVGVGTRAMAELAEGARMTLLGPLGTAFPEPAADTTALLIGGGVGLPPVAAWLARYGRPRDRGYFGGRDGADVPWTELRGRWQVSVDQARDIPPGREAFRGLVTELVAADRSLDGADSPVVLACGPVPMLAAARRLARDRGWDCYVSLEEHMGCGYGACKGCVVPVAGADGQARNATCCQDGPVFPAGQILWDRYGQDAFTTVDSPGRNQP